MKPYNPYQVRHIAKGEHFATLTDHELGLILGALSLMQDMKEGVGEDENREATECEMLRMKLPAWRGE